ncbi:hypothetical protein ES703_76276 [subsurface metagenome]
MVLCILFFKVVDIICRNSFYIHFFREFYEFRIYLLLFFKSVIHELKIKIFPSKNIEIITYPFPGLIVSTGSKKQRYLASKAGAHTDESFRTAGK